MYRARCMGQLPMRIVSSQGHCQQCCAAHGCVFSTRHNAILIERYRFREPNAAFCITPITQISKYYISNMALHPCASFSAFLAVWGPTVVEHKPTILWQCLFFLVSLQASPGWDRGTRRTAAGGEAHPMHGCNTTVTVDNISDCRPSEVWTQPCVCLLSMDGTRRDGCLLYACSGHP